MSIGHLYRHSLKARITLFTLLIFVSGIWSLAFYAERMLRRDMQAQLESQQFSTVSLLASEVDQDLRTRLRALESIAAVLSPVLTADPQSLQQALQGRPVFLDLFNGGAFITDVHGTVIASLPESLGRKNLNFLDRDYIHVALRDGKPTIGQPVMGRQLRSPILGMGIPIRDANHRVIGALAGVTNLGEPNFLDRFANAQYAKTGSYLLVDPRHRLIVTGTPRSRTMEVLPARGASPILDRFIDGFEGSEVFVNPIGIRVLASVKRIAVADWYAAVALPTEEAFSPIRSLQQRILLATLAAELLASQIAGEPLPLPKDLVRAIDPMRYAHKKTFTEETSNEN